MTNGGRRQHFCVGNVPGVSRCRSTTAEDPGVHSQDAATATRRPSSGTAMYIQLGCQNGLRGGRRTNDWRRRIRLTPPVAGLL